MQEILDKMQEILEMCIEASVEWKFKNGVLILGDTAIIPREMYIDIVTPTTKITIKECEIIDVCVRDFVLFISLPNTTIIRVSTIKQNVNVD